MKGYRDDIVGIMGFISAAGATVWQFTMDYLAWALGVIAMIYSIYNQHQRAKYYKKKRKEEI